MSLQNYLLLPSWLAKRLAMIYVLKVVGLHFTWAQFVAIWCLWLLAEISCFQGVVMMSRKSQCTIYCCPCLYLLVKTVCKKCLILVSQYDYPPLNKLGWLCRQTALKFIFPFILLITNNHKHYWIIMYPLTAMQSMFSTTVISTRST